MLDFIARLFRKAGASFDTLGIAEVLLNDYALKIDNLDAILMNDLSVGDDNKKMCEHVLIVYKVSLLLLVLLGESGRDKRWKGVCSAIENNLISSSRQPGILIEEVNRSMQTLRNLFGPAIDPANHPPVDTFRWAKVWVKEFGSDEGNPMRLHCAATHWMRSFIMLTKTARRIAEQ